MSKWFTIKAKKRISLKATERANHRWAKVRAEQASQDAHAPKLGIEIVERIIRIIGETTVQEAVIYRHDEWLDRKRKLQALHLAPIHFERAITAQAHPRADVIAEPSRRLPLV